MDGRRAREVLGVGNDAGPAEIRRAFRARALVTHPDHGGSRAAFAELLDAVDAVGTARSPESAGRAPIVARRLPDPVPLARIPFDAYDSPRYPTPPRLFADVLQAATARFS
jgi:curved DNA-binding protein CbpA